MPLRPEYAASNSVYSGRSAGYSWNSCRNPQCPSGVRYPIAESVVLGTARDMASEKGKADANAAQSPHDLTDTHCDIFGATHTGTSLRRIFIIVYSYLRCSTQAILSKRKKPFKVQLSARKLLASSLMCRLNRNGTLYRGGTPPGLE